MRPAMRRLAIGFIPIATLFAVACGAAASGAGSNPGAAVARPHEQYLAAVPHVTFSGDFSEVISLKDFAPGAWTPAHSDTGVGLATVLSGQLTFRSQGLDKVISAGGSFNVQPGQVHQVGNNGTGTAEMMVVQLIPAGTRESTLAPGSAMPSLLPTTPYTARLDGLHYPAAFNLGSSVVDFPARAWTPQHKDDGFVLLLVASGQVETRIGAADQLHNPGDLIRIDVGTLHQIGNPGAGAARVLKVSLQPAA